MIPSFNGLGAAASDMFGGLAASLKDTERAANIELQVLSFCLEMQKQQQNLLK